MSQKNQEDPATDGEALEAPIVEMQSFAELNLSAPVLDSLAKANFVKPTSIQAQFIPHAMTGQDVMGQAKTGTGKTAAFLLPIFEYIKPGAGRPQALILAPTRELALQIHGEIGRLGSTLGFASITLYGGASYEPQIEALASGVDIVVGTPGRVMDHMRSQRLDLGGVQIAVLDEADRMLDLGFRKDIEYILRHCPKERQTLLLSATIPDEIKKLAQRFMVDPLEVWTAPESLTVDTVEQHFFVCEKQDKFPILLKLLEKEDPPLTIIFCGTKMGAKRLAEKLKRLYINAREIHGDLQQSRREKILTRFRTGQVKMLIATDVASRGIDVQNITHIINYDIPYKIEDYVHRIGRTGRIGKSGKAYTFVTREEGSYLTEIELLINKEISRMHFDDLNSKWWPNPPSAPPADYEEDEPSADVSLPPREQGGRGGGGRSRSRSGGRGRGESRGRSEHAHAPAPAGGQPLGVISDGPGEIVEGGAEGAPAAEGADSGDGRRRRRRRGGKGRGEPITITCSQCGTQAVVNFKPQPDRPVYCSTCYEAKKAAKEAARGATASSEPAGGTEA
jgi:CxxC-x17-CxxC domain-containing protein